MVIAGTSLRRDIHVWGPDIVYLTAIEDTNMRYLITRFFRWNLFIYFFLLSLYLSYILSLHSKKNLFRSDRRSIFLSKVFIKK